jgi:hypothetical protein
MKRIKLTQGKFASVSDVDYTYLNQFKWHYNHGRYNKYAVRDDNGRSIWMHRVILERKGHINFTKVDHKDGDGLNNQRRNLRPATNQQNICNQIKHLNNCSGFKGVHWDKLHGKWRAMIQFDGHKKHLGYFMSKREAAQAYNKAAKKYHGKFARLNRVVI